MSCAWDVMWLVADVEGNHQAIVPKRDKLEGKLGDWGFGQFFMNHHKSLQLHPHREKKMCFWAEVGGSDWFSPPDNF